MYYSNNVWSSKCSKKRKLPVPTGDEEEEEGGPMIPFPLMFPKTNNTNIHTHECPALNPISAIFLIFILSELFMKYSYISFILLGIEFVPGSIIVE